MPPTRARAPLAPRPYTNENHSQPPRPGAPCRATGARGPLTPLVRGPMNQQLPRAPEPGLDPQVGSVRATALLAGDCGLICRIEGDREDIERLKVMGLCLGRRIHVVKTGDPMIVSVMGTRIGIARELAGYVSVTAEGGHFCGADRTEP